MQNLAKVAWSEGMLLRPQHFQQQDRFLYHVARSRNAKLAPYGHGVTELALDEDALRLGQVSVVSASGLFPDGMPFRFDQQNNLALEIPEDTRDELVYLALPLEKQSGLNVAAEDEGHITRFSLRDMPMLDDTLDEGEEETLGLAYLNPCLKLGRESMAGYVSLPVARIVEVVNEQEVKLDHGFMAPCLDIAAVQPLTSVLEETLAMVKQRAKALAARMQKVSSNRPRCLTY